MSAQWASRLRTLRKRLRLNQSAFAELVGVSQSHVSRVESGLLVPSAEMQEAVERLLEDPKTRSVFDDYVATLKHSPFCTILIEPAKSEFLITAASPRVQSRLEPFSSLREMDGCENLVDQYKALIEAGLGNGKVHQANGLWHDRRGQDRYWSLTYSPVRDEAGVWYVSTGLQEIERDLFRQRKRLQKTDLAVTPAHTAAI